MRLTATLDTDTFSEAERSVLRLDGDCVALGLTVVPVDVPVSAEVRAASLMPAVVRHDLVVDLLTAAWVHGAIDELPRPLTLAVDVLDGPRMKAWARRPREAHFRRDDLVRLGGVRVTTPLKTAFDLLRLEAVPTPDTEAVAAALLFSARLSPTIAAAMAQLQIRCPNKQRGIDRLATLRVEPNPPAGAAARPGPRVAQPALTR